MVATMTEKNLNDDAAVEIDAAGNTIERNVAGEVVKIVDSLGVEYTARNLSAKAGAELVKRVEDYRWAHKLSVAEFVIKATEDFLAKADANQS